MRVYGFQMDVAWNAPAHNLAHAEAWIRRAAAQGADLVALPEMFATGYSMKVDRAAGARQETEAHLQSLASELGLAIVAGTAERIPGDAEGRGVNVALAVGPEGRLGRYEKIHPFSFAGEHHKYRGGEALCTFPFRGVKVGLFVCYDLRFPEVFRAAADGMDLAIIVANWPEPRRYAWRQLLIARAIECQCFVLGVNRVGEGGGLVYTGDTLFVDPLGEILSAAACQEALVGGLVEASQVQDVRARFPFLSDRRPEVYRDL